jgi:hypothetical protein
MIFSTERESERERDRERERETETEGVLSSGAGDMILTDQEKTRTIVAVHSAFI